MKGSEWYDSVTIVDRKSLKLQFSEQSQMDNYYGRSLKRRV
jgi:hypothetical protein